MVAPVRYGSGLAGVGVYLFPGQFLSRSRAVRALQDLFGVVVAEGTLAAWTKRIAGQVTGKASAVIGNRIARSGGGDLFFVGDLWTRCSICSAAP